MDLLLIRHALPVRIEAAEGPADPPLAPAGHEQSELLAEWLAAEPLDAVYVSPLARARETAVPLCEVLGHEAVVEEGLAEYDRHSNEYVPIEELKAANDPRWQQVVDGGYFDELGLTPAEFQATVVEAVDRIIGANPGRVVAAVCHGGVINAYLAAVLGIDDFLFFEPAYTGISRVKASSSGHRTIVSVNETAHLRGR